MNKAEIREGQEIWVKAKVIAYRPDTKKVCAMVTSHMGSARDDWFEEGQYTLFPDILDNYGYVQELRSEVYKFIQGVVDLYPHKDKPILIRNGVMDIFDKYEVKNSIPQPDKAENKKDTCKHNGNRPLKESRPDFILDNVWYCGFCKLPLPNPAEGNNEWKSTVNFVMEDSKEQLKKLADKPPKPELEELPNLLNALGDLDINIITIMVLMKYKINELVKAFNALKGAER